MTEAEKRFEFAFPLIKKAGAFLLKNVEEAKDIRTKGENDYVTRADKDCERLLIDEILSAFPFDSIYGEESGDDEKNGLFRWIIDPIDGTVNYMNSFPCYTISVALEEEGKLVAGLVYVPYYAELFSAFKGKGAYLSGKKIKVTEMQDMRKALALCVPPHRYPPLIPAFLEKEHDLLLSVSDIRSIGSAALSLCYVASGRAALYFETKLHIYDIAAGLVIVEEAGGINNLKHEGEFLDVLASAPQFASKALEVVKW